MKNATAVKDPVCGMDVDTPTAAGHSEHKGQTYYFCSLTCQAKFSAHPEQFTGVAAETKKEDHGCCG